MATIDGTSGNDTLNGTSGDDTLTGFAGNDTIDGGDGTDKAVFSGAAADYLILHDALTGTFTVVDKEPTVDGDDGTDVVTDVETLEFSDLNIDLTGGSLPLASADTVEVDEDGTLNDVLPGSGGIDGPDGGTEVNLTYALVDTNGDAVSQLTTAHGVVTITNAATGAYSFEPAEDYHGADSFIFRVTDERGISSEAVVDVTVNSVNDDPVVSGPLAIESDDPYLDDVVLLVNFENGVVDESYQAHALTQTNGTIVNSSQYGAKSFQSTAAVYSEFVKTERSSDFSFGTDDFTMEGRFRWNGVEGPVHTLFSTSRNGSYDSLFFTIGDDLYSFSSGAGYTNFGDAESLLPQNQWFHFAAVRESGTLTYYVNGTSIGSTAFAADMTPVDGITIGAYPNGGNEWNGLIDEFRVTKGVARYTSNFSVPTGEFPTASDATMLFSATEDTAFNVTKAALLANASDIDGGTLDVANLASANASIVDNLDGTWTVTPADDFYGTLTLTYDVIDGQGGSTPTYAEGKVSPVNDAPEVDEGIDNQSTNEDAAFNFAVPMDAFSDAEDATLHLTATLGDGSPLPLWLSFDGTTFTGTPTGLDTSTISVKVTATDLQGLTVDETFDLTVNQVNDAPLVSGPLTTKSQDPYFNNVALLLDFDGDLTDKSPQNATVTNVGGLTTSSAAARSGSASLAMPDGPGTAHPEVTDTATVDMGTASYTIEGWFFATELGLAKTYFSLIDSTGYNTQISVDQGDANGTARMFVGYGQPIVNFPSAFVANQWQHVALVRDAAADVFRLFVDGIQQGTLTDSISDHDAVRLEIGTWTIDSPGFERDFEGFVDEFRVTKGIARYTADFTVPDGPFPDSYGGGVVPYFTTVEDNAKVLTEEELLQNARDEDGDTLHVTNLAISGGNGTVQNNGNGTWTVTPDDDFNGTLTVTYDVSDGQVATSTYAEIVVTTDNDAPVVDQGIANQNVDEEAALNFEVPSDAFSDVDDASLTLTATLDDDSPLPEWLNFDGTTFTGTPDDPDVGTITVKVTATDALGANVSETFELAVNPVNDDPVVSGPLEIVSGDADYGDVVLLLHMNGDLTDSSLLNQTVTNVGSLTTSSGETKFGSGSLDMTSQAGSTYLSVQDASLDMGTGDYTIEGWFNATELGYDHALFTLIDSGGGNKIIVEQSGTNGSARMFVGGGVPLVGMTDVFVEDQWQHVALVRDASAGLFRLFVDGTQVGTLTDSVSDHDTMRIEIGSWSYNSDRDFVGYIDEFRVTKGIARYTADFTVPDEAFADNATAIGPFETSEQTSVVVSSTALLVNATDVDLDTLSVANLASANATIINNGDGTFTVTPDAGFTGTLTLTYDVVDGNGGSASTYAEVLVSAAGAGADEITGTAYGDTIFGGAGDDTLTGGDGDDVLIGGDDDDTLNGGADDDQLFGQDDDDVLTGGAGDDLLDGGDGADTLTGGADNDRLIGGGGSDNLSGGDGDDILEGDICHADPAGGSKSASGMTVAAWQAAGVYLSARGLDGNPAALTFANEGGYTKVGVDGGTQSEGQINHEEAGGTETLIVDFAATVTSATVTFTNLFNNEDGGEQGLWRAYDAVGNLIDEDTFGPADVTTSNNVGTLSITGIGAFDRLEFTAIPTVNEEAEGDTEPGDSSDYFIAQVDYVAVPYTAGDDTLDGGAGDDMLCAGHGDDDLIGGLGQDVMEGGAGADVFIYQSVADSGIGALLRDVINDFDAGTSSTAVDTLDISAIVSGTFDFLGAESETFNGNGDTEARFNNATKILEIDADGDTEVDMEIELKDVDIANLDDSDFVVS
tara:strand:- start:1653 stop:7058 length:5406 start_codon:yes stop_codon:yes gene_type:complete